MSKTNGALSSNLPVMVSENIDLTDKEKQIFDRLCQVLHHFSLETKLRVVGGSGSSQEKKDATPLREMTLERIFGKMGHLQRLLDRVLSCRPTGLARNSRMVLVALYPVVQESFKLYTDISEVLAVLLDRFFDMEHQDCVKAFNAYASAAKQIDELVGFYNWCKDMGIARWSRDARGICDR